MISCTATPPYITGTQEQVGTTQEQVYRGEDTRQRLTINPIIQYITKWDSIRLAPTINYAKCTTLPNREYLVLLGKMTTIIFYSRIISLLKVCKLFVLRFSQIKLHYKTLQIVEICKFFNHKIIPPYVYSKLQNGTQSDSPQQ